MQQEMHIFARIGNSSIPAAYMRHGYNDLPYYNLAVTRNELSSGRGRKKASVLQQILVYIIWHSCIWSLETIGLVAFLWCPRVKLLDWKGYIILHPLILC